MHSASAPPYTSKKTVRIHSSVFLTPTVVLDLQQLLDATLGGSTLSSHLICCRLRKLFPSTMRRWSFDQLCCSFLLSPLHFFVSCRELFNYSELLLGFNTSSFVCCVFLCLFVFRVDHALQTYHRCNQFPNVIHVRSLSCFVHVIRSVLSSHVFVWSCWCSLFAWSIVDDFSKCVLSCTLQ